MLSLLALSLLGLAHALPLISRDATSHRVVAYMAYYHVDQNTGPYTPLLPIVQNNSHITDVNIFTADLHDSAPFLTVGNVDPSDTDFLGPLWDEVAQIQAGGIKVLSSLGGYGANSYILLQNDFDTYYPYLKAYLQKYNLDGLDLDIEPTQQGLQPTPWGLSIVRLLKQLRTDFGPDFLITMAPVAQDLTATPAFYSGFDYQLLDAEAKDADGNHIVNWFNGQFYSGFGDCGDTDTYDSVIQNGYAADRVVMLVPADAQDAQPWCNISTVQTVASELTAKYPAFGGMGGYEYTFAGTSDNLTRVGWFQAVASAL